MMISAALTEASPEARIAPTYDEAACVLIADSDDLGSAQFVTDHIPEALRKAGLVDEIVDMPMMRNYIVAFTDSCYQNPESICPFHQMLLPRTIRDYDNLKK